MPIENRPIRIVYFYQYFGTARGGWSTRVYEMCRRWVNEGHHVTVITTPYDKSDIPRGKGLTYKLDVEGIEVIVLNFPISNKKPVPVRIWDFIKYITVAVFYGLRLPYDVAICSSGPITVGAVGIICSWIRRSKVVFEVRDLWPDGAIQLGIINSGWMKKMAYRFEAMCYRKSKLVVAASEGMQQDIVQRFPKLPVMVVPNASDIELFADATPASIPADLEGKQIFLYAGSLGQMDHCMQLMHAAEKIDRVNFPDIRIVIIGEGVDREAMMAYKAEKGLDHVLFLGLIPKTAVAGWFRHAVASLISFYHAPVLQTSSPNKLFDSFAAGVPVIQNTQGWIKKLLEESACGITVQPEQPEQMAAAIQRYVADPALRHLHAANARLLALTRFNRDTCAADMLGGLKAVVNGDALANHTVHAEAVKTGKV